jgi:RHS repeat-associated protein
MPGAEEGPIVASNSLTRRASAVGLAMSLLVTMFPAVPGPVAAVDETPDEPTPSLPSAAVDEPIVVEVEPAPINADLRPAGGAADPIEHADLRLTPETEPDTTPASRSELPDQRSEFSRVFANPDGTFDLEVSQARLHYRDDDTWEPIDLGLVDDSSGPYELRVRANDRVTRFSTGPADEALAALETDTFSLGLRALGYGAGRRASDRIAVPATGDRGAVEAIPVPDGFEFRVVLDRADQATTYHFALDPGTHGVRLGADGRTVELYEEQPSGDRDTAEEVVGGISAPILIEGEREEGTWDAVSVRLTAHGTTDLPADVPADVVAELRTGEVLLTYQIDEEWLTDPAREFPVILDPVTYSSSCIGNGASGCTSNTTTGSFDEFLFNQQPDYHTVGWTVLRTGYDNRNESGTPGPYGTMRSLLYFPDPNTELPDGAQVTKGNLKLTIDAVFGSPVGETLRAYRVNRGWGTNSVTWNDMHQPTVGYDSPGPTTAVPSGATTGTAMNFDVTAMARQWYTRRLKDWKPNIGMLLRFTSEGASHGEVTFRKFSSSTVSHRPLLTLTYTVPKVDFDFDTALLGQTYAPSSMVVGGVTKLPIRIANDDSGYAFESSTSATDHWLAGYRFFKPDGTVAASGTQTLPSDIGSGNDISMTLNVTPPSEAGSYTLRLDLVHVKDGQSLWSSDWARPSKFNSRDMKILSSDNTRWTGSSVIERAEFGIDVTAGGGTNAGAMASMDLSAGVQAGLNLNSANLHLEADAGIGFADRGLDLSLSYGYDRVNVGDCSGLLAACGWYTNWDERFVSHGEGAYTYQDPSGNRYRVDTTPTGQLAGSAPVRLERERITFFDENRLAWGSPAPVMSTADSYFGTYSQSISASNGGTTGSGPARVDLITYPLASVWLRSTGTDRAALGFKVYDRDTGAYEWFYYTFGNTAWTFPGGVAQRHIDTGTAMTSAAGYHLNWNNLFVDVRAEVPEFGRDLWFTNVKLAGSSGGTGTLYFDSLRFQSRSVVSLQDGMPAWTANGAEANLYSADKMSGTHSIQVHNRNLAGSPDCVDCSTVDLGQAGFLQWNWKKVGGTVIARVVYVKNKRTNATGTITYYAGPDIPTGSVNPVQVARHMPADWQLVRRDLHNDARQIFNWYNDYPHGDDPADPPASGPVGDDVTVTGFKLAAIDGNFWLFDYTHYSSAIRHGSTAAGEPDFVVTYPDRERHLFNADGLLERVIDRHGNTIELDYSFATGEHGPNAYTLTAIRAPTDATGAASGTYRRHLTVSRTTPSTAYGTMTGVSVIERLGTSVAPLDGRRADFFVGTAAAGGSGLVFGAGDLAMVSPGRSPATSCWGARPTSCIEFDYANSTLHRVDEVRDPRWAGATSGADDLRWTISYGGGDPWVIRDRSKSATGQLMVISYNDTRVAGLGAKRVIWQDAAARAANVALIEDLSPEGSRLTTYVRKPCATNPCDTGTVASYPASPSADDVAARFTFNGLSQTTHAYRHRCPATASAVSGCSGTTALVSAERQQRNAAAKVDNVPDPLAADRVLWTQTADQHIHSLIDSSGTNPDLYRTEMVYDDDNQVVASYSPVTNRQPHYADRILSVDAGLEAYWRLGDASGDALDSSGNDEDGTVGSAVVRGVGGALIRDTDGAMEFTGASGSRVTSSLSLPQTEYSLSGWIKLDTAGQTSKGLIGDWLANSGARIYIDATGVIAATHKNVPIASTVTPGADRWYHVVCTWSGSLFKLYVDGELTSYASSTAAPGTGNGAFEIGSTSNGTGYVDGTIDEVSVQSKALSPDEVMLQYVAGRAVARHATLVAFDDTGSPLETHDNFLLNGGFEDGFTGWRRSGTVTSVFGSASDPNVNSGFASMSVTGSGAMRQDVQTLPGQTVRVQFAGKTDGGASTRASWAIYYRTLSTGQWVAIDSDPETPNDIEGGTFVTKAFDITLPFDATGAMRLVLDNSADTGVAYFDDVLVVSNWSKLAYGSNGLVTDEHRLRPGSASGGAVARHFTYAASASVPGIFPTGATANYVDGVLNAQVPDKDVTTTTSFDAWGRAVSVTDADGVTHTTHYRNSGNGVFTDVDWVEDGIGNRTTTAHDAIGNPTLVTNPSGEATATTWTLAGNPLTVTTPDGVVTQNVYDSLNRLTSTIENHQDGAPSGPAGDDDLTTAFTYDGYGNRLTASADEGSFGGAIKQLSSWTYDLRGNVVSSTVFADSAHTQARTTTNYFATRSRGGTTYSEPTPSGRRDPIAPTAAPAPLCPGVSGTYCSQVTDLDMNGRALSTTDAYGVVTVTDRDVAGRQVRSIANFVAGGDDTESQNVTATTAFDVAGNAVESTDAAGRKSTVTYDALNRPTVQTAFNDTGAYSAAKTVYLPSGRIDRVSRPATADPDTPDGDLTWTRTEYDVAGRAVRTLEHYDIDGDAHLRLDGFETGADGWSTSGLTGFISGGATMALDSAFHATGPRSGDGRLRVTTHAATTNTGTAWNLSGQTFTAGRTYRMQAAVRAPSGTTVQALFGTSASQVSTTLVANGAWQTLSVDWVPASTTSADVFGALRKEAAGTLDFYIDDFAVWDTADPGWNIPTETAHDAAGRVVASTLPPSTPTQPTMTTTTAYDATGRVASVSANAQRTLSHAMLATASSSLVGYWPLDERGGGTATDQGGNIDGSYAGAHRKAVAGAADEARTSVWLNGTDGLVTVPDSTALDIGGAISLAYWARSDVTLDSTITEGWVGGVNRANTYGLGWTSSVSGGGWRFQVRSGATTHTVDAPNAKVEAGRWYFVAGSYDGNVLRIYVDGTLVASNTIGAQAIDNTAETLGIGQMGSGFWGGAIDEVGLWSDDLSSTQVTELYLAARRSGADVALTTRTAYDALGRSTSTTSPRGIQTRHEYDRLGRMVATVANARDGAPASATSDDDVRTTFAYNLVGELIGHCPAKQVHLGGCDPTSPTEEQAWRYAYDAMGRQITQTPPVNTTATALDSRGWTYEAGGRLLSVVDFVPGSNPTIHRHTDFVYDPLNRVTDETVYLGPGTSNPELTWTTTWNADSSRASRSFDGDAASTAQPDDSWSFTYDDLGRPDLVKQGATTVTDYAWSPDGSLTSRTDLGIGGTTSFGYDWAGRQTNMTAPALFGGGSIGLSYSLDGLLNSRTTPNGVNATLSYDAAKRPLGVNFSGDTLTRAYDRDGNVTAEGRSLTGVSGDAGSGTATFTFDGLGRVTAMDGLARDDTFTYDRNGNRVTKTEGTETTTYTYDRTDQLIGQTIDAQHTAFGYNAYGDMTHSADAFDEVTVHAYDAGSRLIGLTPPGETQSAFTYDALARVTTRTTGAASLTYRYVGTGHVSYASVPGSGAATYSLVDATSARLGLDTGGVTGWSLFDLHGNLAGAMASGSDTVVSALRYDAYGQLLDDYTAGSGATETPWRYQGRLDISPDADEALYDFGARLYRPSAAAFTQLDTYAGKAVNPLSMNRFLYAHANPVTLVDPDGHSVAGGPMIDGTVTHQKQQKASSSKSSQPAASDWEPPLALDDQLPEVPLDGPPTEWEMRDWKDYAVRHPKAVVVPPQSTGVDDGLQFALDSCGLIPVIGIFCDVGSAITYAVEGDFAGAGLSLAGAVPVVGEGIGAARIGIRYADEALELAAGAVRKGGDSGDGLLTPGPFAGRSIPGDETRNFTRQQRDELNDIMSETGCHRCESFDPGTKSGNAIPDHQPPLSRGAGPYQLYPHCLSCSREQGLLLANMTRRGAGQ